MPNFCSSCLKLFDLKGTLSHKKMLSFQGIFICCRYFFLTSFTIQILEGKTDKYVMFILHNGSKMKFS